MNQACDDCWQYREIQRCLWGKAACFGFSSLVSERCCTAKPPTPSTVPVLLLEHGGHCLHKLSPVSGITFNCYEDLKSLLRMVLLLCPLATWQSQVPLGWCQADHLLSVEFKKQNKFVSLSFSTTWKLKRFWYMRICLWVHPFWCPKFLALWCCCRQSFSPLCFCYGLKLPVHSIQKLPCSLWSFIYVSGKSPISTHTNLIQGTFIVFQHHQISYWTTGFWLFA